MPSVVTKLKIASIAPYQQIEQDLRRRIEEGEWTEGMMIPSRRALAAEYHVEVPTMQRAIAGLLKASLLHADGGRGTFVAQGVGTTARVQAPAKTSLGTIGIVSASRIVHNDGSTDEDPWNNTVVRSVERALSAFGGSSVFADLVNYPLGREGFVRAIEEMAGRGVTGMVIVAARAGGDMYQNGNDLPDPLVPTVLVGGAEIRLPVTQVYFDDRDGGQAAAAHLIERGAKRLLYFSSFTEYWVLDRQSGAREAVEFTRTGGVTLDAGVDPRSARDVLDLIRRDSSMERVSYEFAKTLLEDEFTADGVIACNDLNAYGFLRAAEEKGLRGGYDFLIAGFDDDARSKGLGLTTMHPPLESMGEEAARLIWQMREGSTKCQRVCLHSDLIARRTTQFT